MMFLDDIYERAGRGADRAEVIGRSALGRDIWAFIKGRGGGKVLIHGSIHAREHITAKLVAQLAEEYTGNAEIWFVPVVNPDGVMLAKYGLISVPLRRRRMLYEINNASEDFSLWKANANAVDLNVNFDALWGRGASNIRTMNSENYIGPFPFSEPETRALRRITLRNNFNVTISYHTKGQEIYWGFDDNYLYYDEGMEFSALTGYPLLKSIDSAGGYKDWFVQTTRKLGLTIETGNDIFTHPLGDEAFDEIYQENKGVPALAGEISSNMPPY